MPSHFVSIFTSILLPHPTQYIHRPKCNLGGFDTVLSLLFGMLDQLQVGIQMLHVCNTNTS